MFSNIVVSLFELKFSFGFMPTIVSIIFKATEVLSETYIIKLFRRVIIAMAQKFCSAAKEVFPAFGLVTFGRVTYVM
jgi:hypothetical protein